MKKYSKNHLWVDFDTAQIGLTEFAVSALGGVLYFELPKIGEALTKNEAFGSFESAKLVMELTAPVSGLVIAVNDKAKNAEWLLQVTDIEDNNELLNKAEYDAFVAVEFA